MFTRGNPWRRIAGLVEALATYAPDMGLSPDDAGQLEGAPLAGCPVGCVAGDFRHDDPMQGSFSAIGKPGKPAIKWMVYYWKCGYYYWMFWRVPCFWRNDLEVVIHSSS